MDFNAVYHQASDNYCYPLNEDELIINIKTGYDVQSVSIILGDPFAAGILGGGEHWDGAEEAIIYKKRLKNQIWWTTTVRPEYKRLKYYFKLQTENESWFYFEDGFVSDEQMHLEKPPVLCISMDESVRCAAYTCMGKRYCVVSDFSGPFL